MAEIPHYLLKIGADITPFKEELASTEALAEKQQRKLVESAKVFNQFEEKRADLGNKVNNIIKKGIDLKTQEVKVTENITKQLKDVETANNKAFDRKKLVDFRNALKDLPSNINLIDNISIEELQTLEVALNNTKDNFEALNVIVDFFETKMKGAAVRSADSVEILNQKIEETRLNIADTEKYIKDIDNQIDNTAPGRVQVGLIEEREAAKKALLEENVALEDYKNNLKSVRAENISLASQLTKVKDEMVKLELEGQRGSDQYNELASKAEQYRKVLKDTNEEITRSASDTAGLDQLIGAATGLVGVFTAAQGAAALFGDESEDLEKALVKITGAIALLNGLQAVGTELSKKDALTTKALAFVKTQYAVATNTAATATARFAAALKLTGIGLIIGALAAAVVYWEDIKKAIKGSTDELDRSNEVNARASDLMGEQVAKMRLLVSSVDKQNLSLTEQKKAVKDYNEEFGKTFGTVKSFQELQDKLIASGPAYIKYLELKARGEAAYQIALEKTKLLQEQIRTLESGETLSFYGDLQEMSAEIDKFFGKNVGNEAISEDRIYNLLGLDPEAFSKEIKSFSTRIQTDLKNLYASSKDRDKDLDIQGDALKELEKLSEEYGITVVDTNKNIDDSYKKLAETLQDLVKKQRDLKTQLISNDREREKQILKDQIEDEKAAYLEKIKNLEGSEKEKLKIIQEFNRIYNDETGTAYEIYRQKIKAIDDKYNADLEKVQLSALQAIDEILLSDEERQRKAIKKKFDNIRDELFKQIEQTNDAVKNQKTAAIIFNTYEAEEKETGDFDISTGRNRIEREKKTAETILKIFQANNRAIVGEEKLKQLQLLSLEKEYLIKSLNIFRDSLKTEGEKSLFENLIDELATSADPDVLVNIADRLKETFGEEVSQQILDTVFAIKEVNEELKNFKAETGFDKVTRGINEWTSSLESFSEKLADVLLKQFPDLVAQSGVTAQEFADSISTALFTTFNSIQSIFESEVQGHRQKLDSLQETIDGVETELDRERELYEQGFANNFEAREQDLQNLKEQKRKEEQELKKAQQRKEALQKAEFLLDTVSQISNLVTAASNIFKWAAAIPFVGVPIAIGLIATMFGAFSLAKVKAFQAIGNTPTYRTGLQKGRVHLSGPSHEEGGYGVHDSRTGNKVAEVENNEDLYVLNPQQQRAYNHLLDMMIADSRGQSDLETSLRNHYNFPKTGQHTLQVVERVNTIMLKSQDAKAVASKENQSLVKELRDFKETFKNEFEGYKRERDEEIKSWETPEYYHVKKGTTTKNYPKNKAE